MVAAGIKSSNTLNQTKIKFAEVNYLFPVSCHTTGTILGREISSLALKSQKGVRGIIYFGGGREEEQ